jgi:hypothetical protein
LFSTSHHAFAPEIWRAILNDCAGLAEALSITVTGHLKRSTAASARVVRRDLDRLKAMLALVEQVGVSAPKRPASGSLTICAEKAVVLDLTHGVLMELSEDDPEELRQKARYLEWLHSFEATIEREASAQATPTPRTNRTQRKREAAGRR